jgi:hypothetical protein
VYQGNAYSLDAVMPAAIATGLFVSQVTIQQPTGEQTADGSPASTGGDSGDGWNNVPGLVNIQAMNAPEADARIRAKTERQTEYIEAYQYRHLLLAGYYPQVEQFDNWRAIVDGQAWDPIGVESDSQGTQTRILLQLAGV